MTSLRTDRKVSGRHEASFFVTGINIQTIVSLFFIIITPFLYLALLV